jgi:hypothetical protein
MIYGASCCCVVQEAGIDAFVPMVGPATVGRLKSACGDFSLAAILKAHLGAAEQGAAPAPTDGWVLLSGRIL